MIAVSGNFQAGLRRQIAAYREVLTRSILADSVPPVGEDVAARTLEHV